MYAQIGAVMTTLACTHRRDHAYAHVHTYTGSDLVSECIHVLDSMYAFTSVEEETAVNRVRARLTYVVPMRSRTRSQS
jgi:hypothetical protein